MKYAKDNKIESVNLQLEDDKVRWILKSGFVQYRNSDESLINICLSSEKKRNFEFESLHLTIFTKDDAQRTGSVSSV